MNREMFDSSTMPDLVPIHYVGVTDAAGIAHFDVQGVEVGTYSVRLRVRQLVPAGDTPSTELLLDRLLNVEVR
jgi:hypothetical protein